MILSDTHRFLLLQHEDEIPGSTENKNLVVKTKSSPKLAVLGGMDLALLPKTIWKNRIFLCLCCRICSEGSAVREGDDADSSDMIKINVLSSQWGHSHEKLHSWTCPDLVPCDSHSDFGLLQTAALPRFPPRSLLVSSLTFLYYLGLTKGRYFWFFIHLEMIFP